MRGDSIILLIIVIIFGAVAALEVHYGKAMVLAKYNSSFLARGEFI